MSNRIQHYSQTTEQLMKRFFNTLCEKDQWRYVAIEAQKLGHRGIPHNIHTLNSKL